VTGGREIGRRAGGGRILLGTSLCVLLALLGAPARSVAAPPAAIRVGGPSAPGDPKLAIVAGSPLLRGARFGVYRGGHLVLRGRLRPARGSTAPWPSAFRADLSPIRRPGAYRLHAAGRVSRPWWVGPRGSAPLIPLILRFFAANRDGREPALLHGHAHLHDATVAGGRYAGRTFDLTGGWMDAGDMLHFTQTTAYATIALEAAARLDPGHRVSLEAEADVGVRWLLKAHPVDGLFVTQVGDVRDHFRGFSNPSGDDASGLKGIAYRVAFHWGGTVGGDIGGKAAAALALAAERSPEPARSALFEAARRWYAAGKASGQATPALRHSGRFYVVPSWRDSLAAGAAALYRVSGEPTYLYDARRYLRKSDPDEVLGYANAAPIAAADICGRLGAPALGPPPARRQACRFLGRSGRAAIAWSRRNAFGPAGPFGWGTTSSNGAGGAVAALSRQPGGRTAAAGARDFLLGRNPWGASFVAGFGPKNPRHLSSWASVFGPARPRGAVVGGPAPLRVVRAQGFSPARPWRRFDSTVVYADDSSDYVTSEPALDYAANSILLLAALAGR
jgi:endoglucanase